MAKPITPNSSIRLTGPAAKTAELNGTNDINDYTIHGDSVTSVNFRFPAGNGLKLYGTSFEGGPGIYVDNFSIRGIQAMV